MQTAKERRIRAAAHMRDVRARNPGMDKRKGDRHILRQKTGNRPFLGIDGEGFGTDEHDRQNYMLLCAGEWELCTGKPLTTVECLEFICHLPRDSILVGFAFDYDTAMILRDLPVTQRRRLLGYDQNDKPLNLEQWERKGSPWTFYRDYGVQYLPKQFLKVCRTLVERDEHGNFVRVTPIPNTTRTIYETFGFFQMSFLRALKEFKIAEGDNLEFIEQNKDARETFSAVTEDMKRYCHTECAYLAALMEKLRDYCNEADIKPRSWNGAGKLAEAMHKEHETLSRIALEELVKSDVLLMAKKAYYGGRFEVTRIGAIDQPVYEYDIQSAYPAAMRELPCLQHGKWKKCATSFVLRQADAAGHTYVAEVGFDHVRAANLYGLPLRQKNGAIFWPRKGNGTYWSHEIRAARKLGCRISFKHGYIYEKHCNCQQFDWIEPLFEYRKKIGKSGPGYPIKLGLNSLYGKLAQRIGARKFGNYIWAGMITAITRAKLIDAAAHDPSNVIMLATDAVVSLKPLSLDCTDKLGAWEEKKHDRMFIVQPGLYWGPSKPKTRGIKKKFFETRTTDFERLWTEYREQATAAHRTAAPAFPSVPVEITAFTGLRLAQARGKPETAGRWTTQTRSLSFDPVRKRNPYGHWAGGALALPAPAGAADLISQDHLTAEEAEALYGLDQSIFDAQPDWIELNRPFAE